MNDSRAGVLVAVFALASGSAWAQRSSDCRSWYDPDSDASIRRTDHGADGTLNAAGVAPEVLSISLCAWNAFNPDEDPYTGETVDSEGAHLFRLDVTFAGLVNPPGPIGMGGEPFDPFQYGPSPVVGFIELDVDDDTDTGGELGSAAEKRYTANVGRFGRRPHDELGERIAESRADLDGDFYTSPQYERSGQDFSLVLCGCFTPTVVELIGDGDQTFDPDETWLVMGRFFERAQGYRDASAAYGGSAPGLYDPVVELRFQHDGLADETTVTLVWALDQVGAARLAGGTPEPIDLDVSNQASVVEALADIIDGADGGGIVGPPWELVRHWRGEYAYDYLDIRNWSLTGLFGMPYAQQESAAYAWTDTVGEELWGDMTGDLSLDAYDEGEIRAYVYGADGQAPDADGVLNGRVVVADPGWDFRLFDTNGDWVVSRDDFEPFGEAGDFDRNGQVNTQDFIAYLNAWAAGAVSADFNFDQVIDTRDFIAFLTAWAG